MLIKPWSYVMSLRVLRDASLKVQSMLPLLRRGLGIHHGGLLPMLLG